MKRTLVRIGLFGTALAVAILFILATVAYDRYRQPGPLEKPAVLIIAKGSSVARIAEQLERAGVIRSALLFRIGVRAEGVDSALRAGEFEFPARASMKQAAAVLVSGETVKRRLTVAEGLTTPQVLALLRSTEGLEGQLTKPVREGTLLPETYFFSFGDNVEEVVRRMERAMQEALNKAWQSRQDGLAVGKKEEALILASLIEKETGKADERARISAVFHNRLKRGMRLQTDPTVVYAVSRGEGPINRPLTREDLAIRSPYNTYLNAGLPPGPIANPGLASITAAVNPAPVPDLYFVADGDGGHLFARTLAEHNRNVARWRQIQREREKPETKN